MLCVARCTSYVVRLFSAGRRLGGLKPNLAILLTFLSAFELFSFQTNTNTNTEKTMRLET
jgi:hypothetical protein